MKVKNYGIAKAFHDRYDAAELLKENGVTVDDIVADTKALLKNNYKQVSYRGRPSQRLPSFMQMRLLAGRLHLSIKYDIIGMHYKLRPYTSSWFYIKYIGGIHGQSKDYGNGPA